MIADFVSFCDLPLKNCRVLLNTFAEYEECKLDVSLCGHIKQLRRIGCVWAIIEGHRDVRSINVYLGEGDFVSNTSVKRWTGRRSGLALRADKRRQHDKEGYYEKRKAYHYVIVPVSLFFDRITSRA